MTVVTVEREPTSAAPRTSDPVGLADLAEWPLPVGRVDFDEGLAFLHAPARVQGGYRADDLDEAPAGSLRYELLDGVVVVSPAPSYLHQRVAGSLFLILRTAEVGPTRALFAPYDVRIALDKNLQPDVLVLPEREAVLPVLAVEVLSKYGRNYDTRRKRAAYQGAGIPSYWLVDPDIPEVTVLELDGGGEYRSAGVFRGDDVCAATRPYPVRFRPSDLVD